MTILNKVKWILGIALIFAIVLATNLIDKHNYKEINNSVVGIYEDRLLAKEIIYEIATLVHAKEIAVLTEDTVFFQTTNLLINDSLEQDIKSFGLTELTRVEKLEFDELKKNLADLLSTEEDLVSTNFESKDIAREQMARIQANLVELSGIQIEEGKRHLATSQRAMESIERYTQLEIYFLILLAVIVQIIILYNPKPKTDTI